MISMITLVLILYKSSNVVIALIGLELLSLIPITHIITLNDIHSTVFAIALLVLIAIHSTISLTTLVSLGRRVQVLTSI